MEGAGGCELSGLAAGAAWEAAELQRYGAPSCEGEARRFLGSDRRPGPQCQWAPARGTGLHLRASSTPRTFRTNTGRTGTAAGLLARRARRWSSPSACSSWLTLATGWSCATRPPAACSASSTAPSHRRPGRCACAPPRCCSPSAATRAATLRALRSPTAVSPAGVPPLRPALPATLPHTPLRRAAGRRRGPGATQRLGPDPCSSPRRDQRELQPPAWGSEGYDGG